ncbi:penicillin-binding protein 2 [Elusimicrobiota bacterium]
MPDSKYYYLKGRSGSNFGWARILIILFFSVFALRLAQMQLIKGSYYWSKAEENRLQYFSLPAPRGRIFDRNGIKLAGNQPSYSLFIHPLELTIEEKNRIAGKIEEITKCSKEKILRRFISAEPRPFGIIELVSNLTIDEIVALEENSHYLPGVTIQVEPRRKYPFSDNGSHLLGYIGEIDKYKLSQLKKYGYKLKDKVGKSGLEKTFDKSLRGNDGFQEIEVGVKGGHRKIIRTYNPQIGNELLLTIDWDLQQAAYRAMGEKAGAVVAMDPNTGEILVWLSKPGFNPEDFTIPLTQVKAKEMFSNPDHPLFDRIIQGQYAPGSIFKIMTAATSLEADENNTERKYECKGQIAIGYDRKVFKCWKDKKHGKLELLDAVANSCNVYFYQLGIHLGAKEISNTAKKFGLGSVSQKIYDGENPGLIPDPEWKKSRFGIGWYPGDNANMSVGQGYVLVNPMQILKMVSAVATEGKMYNPYVVKTVISPDGDVIEEFDPLLERKIDVKPFTFKKIKEAMTGVVDYGTAKYLYAPVKAAGKTGTAENPMGDDHAWFTCFAPVENPEIAIVVLIENGGYGSVAAMPVAREILKEKFPKK